MMNKTKLRKLVREEIQKIIKESNELSVINGKIVIKNPPHSPSDEVEFTIFERGGATGTVYLSEDDIEDLINILKSYT